VASVLTQNGATKNTVTFFDRRCDPFSVDIDGEIAFASIIEGSCALTFDICFEMAVVLRDPVSGVSRILGNMGSNGVFNCTSARNSCGFVCYFNVDKREGRAFYWTVWSPSKPFATITGVLETKCPSEIAFAERGPGRDSMIVFFRSCNGAPRCWTVFLVRWDSDEEKVKSSYQLLDATEFEKRMRDSDIAEHDVAPTRDEYFLLLEDSDDDKLTVMLSVAVRGNALVLVSEFPVRDFDICRDHMPEVLFQT
jgi:hypothetical protein